MAEIAEAADVAVGTFYRHFSRQKQSVTLENWKIWLCDFVEALEVRPRRGTPDQMLAAALADLGAATFATAERSPDGTEQPNPMSIMTLMFGDSSEDVTYRAYQLTAETEQALVVLFERRLGFPMGALEPQIIASAFAAAWRVAMGGFLAMTAAGLDPPTPDRSKCSASPATPKGCGTCRPDGRAGSHRTDPIDGRPDRSTIGPPPTPTRSAGRGRAHDVRCSTSASTDYVEPEPESGQMVRLCSEKRRGPRRRPGGRPIPGRRRPPTNEQRHRPVRPRGGPGAVLVEDVLPWLPPSPMEVSLGYPSAPFRIFAAIPERTRPASRPSPKRTPSRGDRGPPADAPGRSEVRIPVQHYVDVEPGAIDAQALDPRPARSPELTRASTARVPGRSRCGARSRAAIHTALAVAGRAGPPGRTDRS